MVLHREDLSMPSAEEEEENYLKNSFTKMMEALKEEMKNCLKEMGKKTNKNWKKSRNPIKQ